MTHALAVASLDGELWLALPGCAVDFAEEVGRNGFFPHSRGAIEPNRTPNPGLPSKTLSRA